MSWLLAQGPNGACKYGRWIPLLPAVPSRASDAVCFRAHAESSPRREVACVADGPQDLGLAWFSMGWLCDLAPQ